MWENVGPDGIIMQRAGLFALEVPPNAQCGVGRSDADALMRYGVFERDVASVQADAAVGIAARSAIFQVAVDGRKGV